MLVGLACLLACFLLRSGFWLASGWLLAGWWLLAAFCFWAGLAGLPLPASSLCLSSALLRSALLLLLACLLPFLAGLLLLLARAFSASGFWLLASYCFLLASFLLASCFLPGYFFCSCLPTKRAGWRWLAAGGSPRWLWLAGWLAGMSHACRAHGGCHMSLARQPGRG